MKIKDLFSETELEAARQLHTLLRETTATPKEAMPVLALLASFVLDTSIKNPTRENKKQAVKIFSELLHVLILKEPPEGFVMPDNIDGDDDAPDHS